MKKTILPILIAGLIVIASTSLAAAVGVIPRQLQIDNTTAPLGTGYIAGTITNSSGAPQENAHVVAFAFGIIGGPAIAIASTATSGHYEITIPEGRFHVIAFKFGEGIAFASPVVVEVGKTTDLDLSLTGGIFNDSVYVSKEASSQPVNGQSAPLNTGGEAIVESVQVVGSKEASTLEIAGTGYIAGTITNSSGAPQENAHVVAFAFGIIGGPAIAIASTATSGHYEITIPEGRFHVIAFKFGEGIAFASPVEVKSGDTTNLDLSLTGGIFNDSVPGSQAVSSQPINGQSAPLNAGGDGLVGLAQVIESKVAYPVETIGKGTIEGEITNQNGNPVAFVRVIAVGDSDPNTTLGFTITHLLIGGKGTYSMSVPAGRYLFVRAGKLPFYLGAWAGPVQVGEGQTTRLDLSITFLLPGNTQVAYAGFQQTAPLTR